MTKSKSVRVRHKSTDYTAIIQMDGLRKSFVVLHITDAHISVLDKSEGKYHQYSARMDNVCFKKREHYRTKKMTTTAEHFLELMASVRSRNVDLVALTGDIVNNPSKSSVRFVSRAIKDAGIPSLYIAGNHDWHYEGMAGTANELREAWTKESLLPLYGGLNPLCFAVQFRGVNFVAIDNSTYQVNEEQLAFYENEVAHSLPTVLLLHIPIYTPENATNSSCGDPRWGWDSDRNYEIERRERWSKSGNLKSTLAFVDRVKNTENLVAVLTGHIHRARVDKLSDSAVQYVTHTGLCGANRVIIFESLLL